MTTAPPFRPPGDADDVDGVDSQRFLTQERVERIGGLVAPLIQKDLSWVERRKEGVEVLDDSALRRQIGVDFSLRGSTSPLLSNDDGEPLYCAPVYVLPKVPSNLMSFDLETSAGNR